MAAPPTKHGRRGRGAANETAAPVGAADEAAADRLAARRGMLDGAAHELACWLTRSCWPVRHLNWLAG